MISNEEISQMKGKNESEASWHRRRKFLVVLQSRFQKERLNTLSYCYVNVLRFGCRYSDKLMDDLYEMACEVANYPWEDPVNMTKWYEIFDETLVDPLYRGNKKKTKKHKSMISNSLIEEKENIEIESLESKEATTMKTSNNLTLKTPADFELKETKDSTQKILPKQDDIKEPTSKPDEGKIEKTKKGLVVKRSIKSKSSAKTVKKKVIKKQQPSNKASKNRIDSNLVYNSLFSALNQNSPTSLTKKNPSNTEINTEMDNKLHQESPTSKVIKAGQQNQKLKNLTQKEISPVSCKMETAKTKSEPIQSKISSEKSTTKLSNNETAKAKPEKVGKSKLNVTHEFDNSSPFMKRTSDNEDPYQLDDASDMKVQKSKSSNCHNSNDMVKVTKNEKARTEQKFYVSNKRFSNDETLRSNSGNKQNFESSKKNDKRSRNSVSPDTGSFVASKVKLTSPLDEDVKMSGSSVYKSPVSPTGGNNPPCKDLNNNAVPSVVKSNDAKMKSKDSESMGAKGVHGKKHQEDGKAFNRSRSFGPSSPLFGESYNSGYNANFHDNSFGSYLRPQPCHTPWYGQDYTFPFYDQYLEYTRNYAPYYSVGKYRSGYSMKSPPNTADLTSHKTSPISDGNDKSVDSKRKTADKGGNFHSSSPTVQTNYFTKTIRNSNAQRSAPKTKVQVNRDTPVKRNNLQTELVKPVTKDSSNDVWLQSVLDKIRKS